MEWNASTMIITTARRLLMATLDLFMVAQVPANPQDAHEKLSPSRASQDRHLDARLARPTVQTF
jgi:hypothetical protein